MPMRNRGIDSLTVGDPNGAHVVISKNPLGVFVYDNPATLRAQLASGASEILSLLLDGSTFSSATANATPFLRWAAGLANNSLPGKLLAYFTGRGTIGETLHQYIKSVAMQDWVSGLARADNKLGYLAFHASVDGTTQDTTELSPGDGNLLQLGGHLNPVIVDDSLSGRMTLPEQLWFANGDHPRVSSGGGTRHILPAFNTGMTVGMDGGTGVGTTDASGQVTYSHTLGTTPNSVVVTINDGSAFQCRIVSISSTGFTVKFATAAGATPTTGTSVQIRWVAFG